MASPEQVLHALNFLQHAKLPEMEAEQQKIIIEATVCHEAGHALIGLHEGLDIRYAIAFMPRLLNRKIINRGLTHCSYRGNEVSRSSALANQRNSLGGIAAEIVHYDLCNLYNLDARHQAILMHAYMGGSLDLYQAFKDEIGDKQALALVTPDGFRKHSILLAERISDCTVIIERNKPTFEAIRSAITRYHFVPGYWIKRQQIHRIP